MKPNKTLEKLVKEKQKHKEAINEINSKLGNFQYSCYYNEMVQLVGKYYQNKNEFYYIKDVRVVNDVEEITLDYVNKNPENMYLNVNIGTTIFRDSTKNVFIFLNQSFQEVAYIDYCNALGDVMNIIKDKINNIIKDIIDN